jgi:hypothetical protein
MSAEAPAIRAALPSNPEARGEIVLRNGRRLVVPANVEPEALARSLPVLERV